VADRPKDKLETLSLGNQQRVQVAASLLHSPSALILDEPFSGLDPVAVDSMVELLIGQIEALEQALGLAQSLGALHAVQLTEVAELVQDPLLGIPCCTARPP
jgi:ABC-type uncharacterized transport system ATPase subunit